MKFLSLIIIFGLTSTVASQQVCEASASAIPSCGRDCIVAAGSSVGCSSLDFGCQCAPSAIAAISTSVAGCVISACGFPLAFSVQTAALAVCSCAAENPVSTTESVESTETPLTTAITATVASPGSTVQTVAPSITASESSSSSEDPAPSSTITSKKPLTTGIIATTGGSLTSVASTTKSVASVTGGQEMLRPWDAGSAALFAAFCSLMALL